METIQAPQAWELETGSAQVVVAVIDTGVDYTHPDLSANMWTNPGEVPGNGVDDDRNGVVDDFYGYDFANGDPDPRDDNVHGTHCAGTVGAVGDNGVGVAGVCWSVRIMALKFLGSDGSGNTSDAIACIHYAIANGADVMSNSWGGGESSRALEEAITAARAAGIVFVAAAGNSGDTRVHYPGAYPAALTVSATDRADALATFSSYGPAVDLAAPGVGIVSCALEHGYASLSGTSMATPHVAGLA
ncbi:MAG: S8 family serine peptidase, partial [Planctomycetes bacterium]|nr:S8 family serine peptidase [Planctomycetota bacterium]